MAFLRSPLWLLLLLSSVFVAASSLNDERKVYIVYMGEKPSEDYATESLHRSMLDNILEDRSVEESLIYSYGRSFNGFAANLTHEEKQKIAGMEGVVSVFPSRNLKLHTTRSWDFLGLSQTTKRNLAVERDVVIGLLDSGIWPESESFSGKGFGPPPSRWKGLCQNFTCNNKIIGARYYKVDSFGEPLSPRDYEGHGSHTSSTAAGNAVANASLLGLGLGVARGAVPAARIAMYKVCWSEGCADHNILAGFDDAIADGVDVLSVSLGPMGVEDYFSDSVAIGSFHAAKKGILSAVSAGNWGPFPGTVTSVAPWLISVGASTMDRRFVTRVVLGNNKTIEGVSINTFDSPKDFTSLVYMKDCYTPGLFDSVIEKDKIVFCDGENEDELYDFGAKGIVALAVEPTDDTESFTLPASVVTRDQALELSHYLHDSQEPVAKIMKSERVFDAEAPAVVSFSSRGPNLLNPGILKPDIVAPGVEILAAWSPKAPFRGDGLDSVTSAPYNIISGTSMSAPHVAGAAAYVKSFHPSWSAGAIMSALITTATPMRHTTHQDAELAYGAGELNPIRARSPGLVYEPDRADYVNLLCTMYTTDKVRHITGDKTTCPKGSKWSVTELNYPTMAVPVSGAAHFRANFPRTVTNVGRANSTYRVIVSPGSVNVDVRPRILSFDKLGEKKSFVVTVSGVGPSRNVSLPAAIMWTDGRHHVRSPINVYLKW